MTARKLSHQTKVLTKAYCVTAALSVVAFLNTTIFRTPEVFSFGSRCVKLLLETHQFSGSSEAGPCANAEDPMDCLHGMLMHGDSDIGDDHKDEDTYLRFKPQLEAGKPKTKAGPLDAEEAYHGALMHGDGEVHHGEKSEVLPEKPREKFGPDDAETTFHGVLMHGDEEAGHAHNREHLTPKAKNKDTKAGPMDAEEMMHGVLMHGDADAASHHAHDASEDDAKPLGAPGPVDMNDIMHGLMHADGDTDHHETADGKGKQGETGPVDQENLMHSLMHGGDGTEHKHGENKPFKFDIDEILKLDIPEDILKSVGLDKVKKMDEDDYQKWKKEKEEDDSDFIGETLAYISDSMLLDIDLMKRRYLARDEKMEKEINDYVTTKNADFSAKEANENLKLEGQEHESDDMTHDLELVGSTDPINARHKAHMELEKSKKKA